MDKKKEKRDKAIEIFNSAEKANRKKEYMKACNYYSQASALFRDINNKEKFNECKKKIIEMNTLTSKHEFKKHSFTNNIKEDDAKAIEEINSKIINLPLVKTLECIGHSSLFCPQIDSVAETASKTMPLTLQLASVYAVDEDGNTIRTSHNGKLQWLMKIYDIQIQFCLKLHFSPIFNRLLKRKITKKRLTRIKLYNFINRNNIIPKNKQEIIKKGIKAFFEHDYISSMHILVPQFEALFLSVCDKIGISTIKIHRGKHISTETITFSEHHLDSNIFQEKWGKDYCEFINFILFKPLGYKIRHKIAHGLIKKEECNFILCLLIIYLYIALSARVKIQHNKE